MKFKDFPYERPNFEEKEQYMQKLIERFSLATTADEQIEIVDDFFQINDELSSNGTIAAIRNGINTKDEFYDQEMKVFDEKGPILSQYGFLISQSIYNSKFKEQLKEKYGQQFFDQIELSLKTFDPKIIPLMIEINKISREYSNLIASAQIVFNGQTYNLSQMRPFGQHLDRKIRHKAQLAVSQFFAENEKEFDDIYDRLVKIRHQMAIDLGYDNFIQLAYDSMGRTDYTPDDVKKYRQQIKEVVVPAVSELNKRKSLRLKIDNLKSYDTIAFLSGNPTPKGNKDDLVAAALKMYNEMSPETGEFFNFMVNHELFDLESKPGKNAGGYCTYIPKYQAPFIFANFNGTEGDVDVLTHEAGHAFQIYSSKDNIPPQRWPGMESAEITSMSMEFLAWPWVSLFFKEDTEKYYFTHLTGTINFLPYGALVDEFQYEVYANPNMTSDERKETWRRLEKIYRPDLDYDDDLFLEKGTYWYRQGHIFESPFYYIDYTLAQVCAFQYWALDRVDHNKTWNSYHHLATLGGSLGFVGLLKEAGLDNPFVEGTIKKTIKPLMDYLDTIDDTKL